MTTFLLLLGLVVTWRLVIVTREELAARKHQRWLREVERRQQAQGLQDQVAWNWNALRAQRDGAAPKLVRFEERLARSKPPSV